MRGNAQKLHFTHSNSERHRNLTDERIDAQTGPCVTFAQRVRVATLSGQRIASVVFNLSTVLF
jgi:hypothetical protein